MALDRSGEKPLPEPMVPRINDAKWGHQAVLEISTGLPVWGR